WPLDLDTRERVGDVLDDGVLIHKLKEATRWSGCPGPAAVGRAQASGEAAAGWRRGTRGCGGRDVQEQAGLHLVQVHGGAQHVEHGGGPVWVAVVLPGWILQGVIEDE